METRKIVLYFAVPVLLSPGAFCQTPPQAGNTGPEMTVHDLNKITLPKPTGVSVTSQSDGVRLTWEKSPLKRVSGYEVYRKAADDSKFEFVTRTSSPSFLDTEVPQGEVKYAVSSVDSHNNKSLLSKPVTIEVEKQ